jgi:AraC-like DNA-binding protein
MSAGSEAVTFRGGELDKEECLVAGPAGAGEFVTRGACRPATLSVPHSVWHAEAHWLRPPASLLAGGVIRRRPGLDWNSRFLGAVDWMTNALTRYPQACTPSVRTGFEELLLKRLAAFDPIADEGLPRTRAAVVARRNAVERARSYMEENLAQPQRLSEVCRYARMEARSLEYAFMEVLGVSPMSYLKVLRLHHAHRRLSSRVDRNESVSRTALDCGCWHLSQFSVDYKRFFGESPSVTMYRKAGVSAERARA